ncbi:MAG: hypothetical protein ACK51L_03805 [bacterium]
MTPGPAEPEVPLTPAVTPPRRSSRRKNHQSTAETPEVPLTPASPGLGCGSENIDPYELTSNHPGVAVRLNKVRPKCVEPEEIQDVTEQVKVYFTKLAQLQCYHRDAKYSTSCTCLMQLDEDTIASLSDAVGK